MKTLILANFILLFFGSFAVAMNCEPSSDACGFYGCAEKFEPCGKSGYNLQFGDKQCKKYLRAEPDTSPEMQEWLPKVRLCLQERMIDIMSETPHGKKYCSTVNQLAFDSHVDCYLETGFCELSLEDKWTNLQLAGAPVWYPESIRVSLLIQKGCLLKTPQPQ